MADSLQKACIWGMDMILETNQTTITLLPHEIFLRYELFRKK
jgi:hypothetical protein